MHFCNKYLQKMLVVDNEGYLLGQIAVLFEQLCEMLILCSKSSTFWSDTRMSGDLFCSYVKNGFHNKQAIRMIDDDCNRSYIVKAVKDVDSFCSTSHAIISCICLEMSLWINNILTKLCCWKLGPLYCYIVTYSVFRENQSKASIGETADWQM